ncbi:MAG TPA: FliH/SctL family protein [Desulfitobacteriaceae bacterium]|jgi:flagellar assembly protein FliH|nr:FliH/SctL family protein [Desulfitobacteriaceae bacterium]
MKSFTKGSIFKSNQVEILTPRLLQGSLEGFERFGINPAVLTDDFKQPEIAESISENLTEAEISASRIIAEAEVQAREIIREAEAKVNELILQSEIESDNIIQKAKMQEKLLREELAQAVREEIEPLAYSEGYQNGSQKAELESRETRERAQALFNLAQRALREEYLKVDDSLLNLALQIARRITGITLALNPRKLLDIVRSLTFLPQEREGWRLHISADDVEWIAQLGSDEQLPCPWVKDETLRQGDCFLECQEGIYDARIEAQLTKMEKALLEELKYEELEATGTEGGCN